MSNIQKLIAFLEELPDASFNMNEWSEKHNCGTVACIGGWTQILCDRGSGIDTWHAAEMKEKKSRDWLGLSEEMSNELFFCLRATVAMRPATNDGTRIKVFDLINRHHAIEALRMIQYKECLDWIEILKLTPKNKKIITLVVC